MKLVFTDQLFTFVFKIALILLTCFCSFAFAAEPEEKLSDRIDFGNSYVMGQTIKSGAVYLTHRKKSNIQSMLKMRENYRAEILEDFRLGEPVTVDEEKAK